MCGLLLTPDDTGNEDKQETFLFKPFGPLELSTAQLSTFWEEIEAESPKHRTGLRDAIGVYIFVTRASTKSPFVPRYVGKTNRGFRRRFNEHARAGLLEELAEFRGKLYVFLLARRDKEGESFMKERKKLTSIDMLETLVIGRCLHHNAALRNAKKVKYLRGLQVPGFINSPNRKLAGPALRLKRMLGTITTKEL